MLKRLFSVGMLLVFLGSGTLNSYAIYQDSTDDSEHNLFIAEEKLNEIPQGKAYKKRIDSLVENSSIEQLELIDEKITYIYTDVLDYQGDDYDRISAILGYLGLKVFYSMEDKKYLDIQGNSLSLEERETAQKEILVAQKQLQSQGESILKSFMLGSDTMKSYSEKGNLSFDMNLNIQDTISSHNTLTFSNYTAENHEFDQQIKGYIKAFTNTSLSGKQIHLELQSFLDFISKDGNIYFLLQELKLEDFSTNPENIEIFKSLITKLQELAKDETYASYIDQGSEVTVNVFKALQEDKNITKILETPLFEAYEKKGETYMLRPTMDFCNSMKKLSGIFDPFSGEACSSSQYGDMLLEMKDNNIEIFFTPGKQNSIVFSIKNDTALGSMNILWDKNALIKISGNIVEPENENINNISFSYTPNKDFIADIKIEGSVTNVKMSFTTTGEIQTMSLDSKYMNIFNAQLRYSGEKLTGTLTIKDSDIDVNCSISGRLQAKYMNLDSQCNIDSLALLTGVIDNKASFSQKIFMDMFGNSNNAEYIFHGKAGENNTLDISIKNIGTRTEIQKRDIITPEKTKNLSDIQDEIYNEVYGDWSDDEYYSDEDYGYDPYSIYNEEEDMYYYCNTYEFNEAGDYETCTEYISEDEYDILYPYEENSYDPYSIYNEEEDMYYYCNTYEFNEAGDYETCTEYISEDEYFND